MCLAGYYALTAQECFNGYEFRKEHATLTIPQSTQQSSEQVLFHSEAILWF